jgi:hypothetical protein
MKIHADACDSRQSRDREKVGKNVVLSPRWGSFAC